jgi:soluble lytic murein transglycosylase-like protein
MVESRGTKTAANSVSTARGYGQLLKGTATYVYETIMKNGKGSYNHSMAFDGNLNIKMTAYYICHLLEKRNGNLFATMKNYSGRNNSGTYSYISMMNSFSSTTGVNIFNLCRLMN